MKIDITPTYMASNSFATLPNSLQTHIYILNNNRTISEIVKNKILIWDNNIN